MELFTICSVNSTKALRIAVVNKNLSLSLVSGDGPMSWVIKSKEVPEKAKKRPSTCPATCSSRTSTAASKASEAVSQDDAAVRQVYY